MKISLTFRFHTPLNISVPFFVSCVSSSDGSSEAQVKVISSELGGVVVFFFFFFKPTA